MSNYTKSKVKELKIEIAYNLPYKPVFNAIEKVSLALKMNLDERNSG